MPYYRELIAAGIFALLAGCVAGGRTRPATVGPPTAPSAVDRPCMQTHHGCIALNPQVTAASIAETICVAGYTAAIRPSTRFTNGVKAKLLRAQGRDRSQMGNFELDHIIPLAVGGHPSKPSNLTLQPWQGRDGAKKKDALERRLQRMVCLGQIGLTAAQHCIAENWQACASDVAAGRAIPDGEVVPSRAVGTAAERERH